MNKKIMIIAGVIALSAALGFGIYQSDASQKDPKLSFDDITNLVSSQYPGTITEMEFEKKHNHAIYEVEIVNDGMKYEIKVDGNSGEIIKLKEKSFVAHEDKDKIEHKADTSRSEDTEHSEQTKIKKSEKRATKKDSKKTIIDATEAIKIAQKEFPGTVTEVELDEDDGRLIYEIEIKANGEEAEFEIDAMTGEIIVIEIDD